MVSFESTCTACGGTGKKKSDSGKGQSNEDCSTCQGQGIITTDELEPQDDPQLE
jgi:DnaJ-class molecular chaperone